MTQNSQVIYPIILHPEDTGGYSVELPDLSRFLDTRS